MTTQQTLSHAAAVPFTFDAAGEWCLGWYHAPATPRRDMAVVLCPPIGREAICSYPTYAQLARALAEAGFPVLRFDYQGTGDSAGDDLQPRRVGSWLDSVEAAVAQARQVSGAAHVALFGLRLGATLAIEAATRIGGVDSLLLWAPCPTGKAFVRELRVNGTPMDDGSLLTFGYHYGAETLQDLLALDATRAAIAPAPRALVIGRDDVLSEGPLPNALRRLGVETEYRVLPGYAAMVGDPREGVLAPSTLEALATWLQASPASAPATGAAPEPMRHGESRVTGAVREQLLQFGPGGALCGVLCEPAGGPAAGRAGHTAVLLLNAGGDYRIGPHRFYVSAARAIAAAGHRVLRLDLAGIGDSPPPPGAPWATLYDRESARDVSAAMDSLAMHGCREFVLMGICSGSYVAYQTALADPRVGGLVLMNSRLLEWTPSHVGGGWQDSMQQYAKSSDYYRRALLKPGVWRRLLRGEVNVRLIANRFLALGRAWALRWLSAGGKSDQRLLARMKRLVARGTDVLMLVSDADDGRDYVEFHFGASGSRLRGSSRFHMAYVPEADHTFTRPGNQAVVIREVLRHLAHRLQPGADTPLETASDGLSWGTRSEGLGPASTL
ncbi:MAG: hypothetical protein AVDCRST_MAG51-2813 [uncultured Ramlibacter sp.]|uniref:Serine aminopeptidase S33 domain-containing protein n=1 Tax=uncultured Ramlibacter sp. TaxID=260755 RepID=A0A6J4Q7X4_9BURK|nr:MAG: hypothetical protein AVDCRST_MAG51-2813 [uncultured Ramlibacter sp.]